ncbi:MAG: hemolysin secretion protein D [Bacteroidetes bacterium HGW-Bacteroidetes-9]|jgi:HlyD family secretion protein|nr:MAG: hemolysin secretion protein D [Bacteroidetes bacterium HGW-Bacteroidetes-9]
MKTINKRHSGLLIAFLTLLLVIALVSIVGWIVIKPAPLILQGQAEANEVRVSGKVPGRIEKFMATEGMKVLKGDTLVYINSPELDAKLVQANSAEDDASAQNQKAIKGARAEQIAGAFEMWQKAEVGVKLAEKTYNRVQNMFNDGVVPAQKRDEAEANLEAAKATSKAAKSQYDMAVNGAEKEDKMAANALVNRAKGAVSEVESYLLETTLISPIDGEVSDVFPKQGELVGSGAPIMNIVDLNDIWVVFNIREDQLPKVKMGTEMEASVPALGNKLVKLKVNYIKAMASYATFKATKTNGGFDVKTFEVRARPASKVDGLRPGMSLMVDYETLR